MLEVLFGGIPSQYQWLQFCTLVAVFVAIPLRWIINKLLKNSVLIWSIISLGLAIGIFMYDIYICFYYLTTTDLAYLETIPDLLLCAFFIFTPLYTYTWAFIFFGGTRWKRRCSKLLLIYHSNNIFWIPIYAALNKGKNKIRNIPWERYLATRVFWSIELINLAIFILTFSKQNYLFVLLMLLPPLFALLTSIIALIVAIKKGHRWFLFLDDLIAAGKRWYDIDKNTNINAQGEYDEWGDGALARLD